MPIGSDRLGYGNSVLTKEETQRQIKESRKWEREVEEREKAVDAFRRGWSSETHTDRNNNNFNSNTH